MSCLQVHNSPVVYVVDDDQAMVESLVFMLEKAELHCRPFSNPLEFLMLPLVGEVGCAIIDLAMPSMSGLELLNGLRARGFEKPVVFLTGKATVAAAVEAMRLGAFDFLEKPIDHEWLLDVVRRAIEYDAKRLQEKQASEDVARKMQTLTARQHEVMECIAEGLPSKQIASKLQISIKTVEVHRSQIAKRLGVNSLAALVQMLTQYKLKHGES
jgi:two-component system, LuxR family, response regulator FixJ